MRAWARRRRAWWIGSVLVAALAGGLACSSGPTRADSSAPAGGLASAESSAASEQPARSAAQVPQALARTGGPAGAGPAGPAIPVAVERQGCVAQPDLRPSRTGERFRDELGVVSRDGSLVLEHGLTHECCHSVDVEVSASGGAVRFLEVWDGDGCRCWCSSRISARTDRLPPGEYTVEVVTARRGGPPEKRLQIFADTLTIE